MMIGLFLFAGNPLNIHPVVAFSLLLLMIGAAIVFVAVIYNISLATKMHFYTHPDFKVLSVREAFGYIKDEVKEFIKAPSLDELSDIFFALNRLCGAIVRRKYIRLYPFDNDHILKCNKRMKQFGHFRSLRALDELEEFHQCLD
jgi:hypothetical protein